MGVIILENQRRAIALYRMSTDRQDLTTQEKSVREFCKSKNFILIDEYYEEGVSGYKTKLQDRTELVKILTRAETKRDFDVFVVYMQDRIGRREDETPFVIQQLTKCNIEVYESRNGVQIKAESHVDKFINYVNSWVAEYESIKTSMRVKDKIKTLNEMGQYTGGTPPFGYELYYTGEITPQGKAKQDLRINEKEAEIIRLIFDLAYNYNYGCDRIANYLNEKGYKSRIKTITNKKTGEKTTTSGLFRSNTISRIIRNPIYIGRQRYNTFSTNKDGLTAHKREEWKTKNYRPELQIIDEDIFYYVNNLMDKRIKRKNSHVDAPIKSHLLCSGIAICHCGGKLSSDYSTKKYVRKTDGKTTVMKTYRYKCSKGRNDKANHGKICYSAVKYDNAVRSIILDFINHLDLNKYKEEMQKYADENIKRLESEINNLNEQKESCYILINKYEQQIDKALLEDDETKMEILIKNIKRKQKEINEIKQQIQSLETQLSKNKEEYNNFEQMKVDFKELANKFLNGNIDQQKAILHKMVNRIVFYEDGVDIELKWAFQSSLNYPENQSVVVGKDSESRWNGRAWLFYKGRIPQQWF